MLSTESRSVEAEMLASGFLSVRSFLSPGSTGSKEGLESLLRVMAMSFMVYPVCSVVSTRLFGIPCGGCPRLLHMLRGRQPLKSAKGRVPRMGNTRNQIKTKHENSHRSSLLSLSCPTSFFSNEASGLAPPSLWDLVVGASATDH